HRVRRASWAGTPSARIASGPRMHCSRCHATLPEASDTQRVIQVGWGVMLELDLSADIQALRHTFGDISEVVDVARLRQDITRLSEEAGAPDLWDDTDRAQKVTSALSHRQSELA